MFVISDSPTFLLEKIAKSKNITIEKIINLSPECYKYIPKESKNGLILFSDSFFRIIENHDFKSSKSEEEINSIFLMIENLLNEFCNLGIHIYIPFVPKHFIYCDRFGEYFFENESKDLFIQSINQKLYNSFFSNGNITFLKGIEKLSFNLSKIYFRFSSIYDEKNSSKILNQYLKHFEKNNSKNKKLIILDLDNTLWKGTLLEDTIHGITIEKSDPIGAIYRTVQKILLQLKEQGFLLAICSKNIEEVALKALFHSKASLFKENDIVAYKINWRTKSDNIYEICKELNLSFYETIFIDDSNHECDEVTRNCKGISTVQVPKNIYNYPYIISNDRLFYSGITSKEDKLRTDLYKKNIKRQEIYNKMEKKKDTKKEWINSLNLELHIEFITLNNPKISRIIQLFNRTNQFNLSNSKYNNLSFNKILKDRVYYYGTSCDRIGSEGLISVVGFKLDGNLLIVHDYILSCRVFGRYLEEAMLLPLFEYAVDKNCDIYFKFEENSRNLIIKKFLKEITSDNYFVPIAKIKSLKAKYQKFPLKMIYHKSTNK